MTDQDTLRMLEDAARGFAAFDAARVRQWRDTPPGFDRAKWREMAEQGWLSILIAEEDGGLGLELDAAVAIAGVLGYSAMPEPFVAAGIVVPQLLAAAPASPTRSARIADVIGGETIVSLAWQNASGDVDIAATAVRATASGDGFALSGESRFVVVPDADAFIVSAELGAGDLMLAWVDKGVQGVRVEHEALADGGLSGWLHLNDVMINREAVIAQGPSARQALEVALDFGVMGNSAELLGIMERELELTLEYLKTRKQFGKAIGSFQVLQHRAVDLWMHKQIAEHAFAASLAVVTAPNVPVAARQQAVSSAKARVARTALDVGNDCIQLHGAIGFTDEYDLSLYANRAIAIAPFGGNAADHLKRYGELKQRSEEAQA